MQFNSGYLLKMNTLPLLSLIYIGCGGDFFVRAESGKYYHRLNILEFILLLIIESILLFILVKTIRKR
ncbi:MAG: hypothetical protein ACP5QK_11790 [Myxococcota bacterium]